MDNKSFINSKSISLVFALIPRLALLIFYPLNANQAAGNFSRKHIPYSPKTIFYPLFISNKILSFIYSQKCREIFFSSSSFSKFLKDLYNSNNGFQLRLQNFNSLACVGLRIFQEKRGFFPLIPCVHPQRDVIN